MNNIKEQLIGQTIKSVETTDKTISITLMTGNIVVLEAVDRRYGHNPDVQVKQKILVAEGDLPIIETRAYTTLLHAIYEILGVERTDVNPDHRFVEDLNMDSLDYVEILMYIEDEWGVDLPDDEFDNLVNPTVANVAKKLSKYYKE